MAGTGGDEGEVDALASGRESAWRPPRWLPQTGIGLAIVALGIGLLLGYIAGRHDATGQTAQPGPTMTSASSSGTLPISLTGPSCSQQSDRRIQLGLEIANPASVPITVQRIQAALPLGGLRQTSSGVGTCGQLAPSPGLFPESTLPAGSTAWLRISFEVLRKCPKSLPVRFRVTYSQAGRIVTTDLDGFPDLGRVPYPHCTREEGN